MFTSTLTVPLPGDGSVTTAFAANSSRCQNNVDRTQNILNPMAAVFDTAGVHEKTGFGCSPPFCRLLNALFCNSGDLCSSLRSPILDAGRQFVKTDRVVLNERMNDPIVFYHQVEDAVEQSDISPRLYRKEKVTGPPDWSNSGIDDNNFGAALARLPDVVSRDGRTFGNIRSAYPYNLRL